MSSYEGAGGGSNIFRSGMTMLPGGLQLAQQPSGDFCATNPPLGNLPTQQGKSHALPLSLSHTPCLILTLTLSLSLSSVIFCKNNFAQVFSLQTVCVLGCVCFSALPESCCRQSVFFHTYSYQILGLPTSRTSHASWLILPAHWGSYVCIPSNSMAY